MWLSLPCLFFLTRENKIVSTRIIQFQEENSETYCQDSTREVSFPQLREKPNPFIALFFYYSTLYHSQIYSSLNCTALLSNTGNFWHKIHRHAVWKYIAFFSRGRKEGKTLFPPSPLSSSLSPTCCFHACCSRCDHQLAQNICLAGQSPTDCLHRPIFLAPSPLSINLSHLPFSFFLTTIWFILQMAQCSNWRGITRTRLMHSFVL